MKFDSKWDAGILSTAVFGAALSLGLLLWRVALTLSFSRPLQFMTTGAEDGSLFTVWRSIHGQTIYADPHRIPYFASYFNWLFYAFYGVVIKTGMVLFSAGDEWIPTIGRWVTLSGCAAGIFICCRVFFTL